MFHQLFSCWRTTSAAGTRRLLRPLCGGMARWCGACVAVFSATTTTPKMLFRPPSSSSSARRRRSSSRELLANWLYGVAHQTALKARATAARREGRERQVTEMPEPAVTEQELWRDLQPLLDQELSRLPDKYRAVIVLCDLEGKTRKEAARQLGVPEGTVASRMATARRCWRSGWPGTVWQLSGEVLAAVLSQNVASAAVPASVVSSTIKAASLFAAGKSGYGRDLGPRSPL